LRAGLQVEDRFLALIELDARRKPGADRLDQLHARITHRKPSRAHPVRAQPAARRCAESGVGGLDLPLSPKLKQTPI
jgi:hypothetical protein